MMKDLISRIGYGVADALFGSHCRICGRPVGRLHPFVCEECWVTFPRMIVESAPYDTMSQQFIADSGFVRAAALFRYAHGSGVASMIHDIKYHGCESMGRKVGRYAAHEIMASGVLSGVDALVPVPIHWTRRMKRGYNQTEVIARGISDVSGLPVVKALVAVRPHMTQTKNSFVARLSNLRGAFAYIEDSLKDYRHVLIIDDVYTTGATMKSAAEVLSQESGVRYSIFTLAAASTL